MILWCCERCDSDRDGLPADGPTMVGRLARRLGYWLGVNPR